MSLPQSQITVSIEEYLARERESEERHEFLDGQIYEMAGENPRHGAMCIVSTQLLGTPCQAFSKDTKVRSGPEAPQSTKGLFSYPDLVVVCGEIKFHDQPQHVIINPTVIIEVLSPNTEAFDRGVKWLRYQTWLPTLIHYVMVSQNQPQIEHYSREANGEWRYSRVNQIEGSVTLASIGCTLKLAEVYDRVVFPELEELTVQ